MKPSTPSSNRSSNVRNGIVGAALALGIGTLISQRVVEESNDPDHQIAQVMQAIRDTTNAVIESPRKKETIMVRWNTLVFRNEPNFNKETKAGYFRQGTKLEVMGKKGFWLKVKNPKEENKIIWIWGGYLKNESQIQAGRSIEPIRDGKDQPDNTKTEIKLAADPHFDFTPDEKSRLQRYGKMRANLDSIDHDDFNRTFPHRHKDHEILLGDLLKSENGKTSAEIESLRSLLQIQAGATPLFVDIGPGIANRDTNRLGGKGKPAITLQEIAEAFPKMQTVGLDLPSQIDAFMGKDPAFKIDEANRQQLLAYQNIHLMAGNGLSSLKRLFSRTDNNPIPERQRPQITRETTLIIRSANALDLYENWNSAVKFAFIKLAEDFPTQAILYLYNREIIIKPAGSQTWSIVGGTSNRGFDAFSRDLKREGQSPYRLNQGKLNTLSRSPIAKNDSVTETDNHSSATSKNSPPLAPQE